MTTSRRLTAVVLATACVTATLAATGSAAADPGHEDPDTPGDVTAYDGPLALIGPRQVKVRKFGQVVAPDLRVRAIAGAGDLEVRSNRPATNPYEGPITTTWTLGDRSGTFQTGLQQDFSGLPGLLRISMTDAEGERVGRTKQLDACLNGDSVRIQPEGKAANAYPWGCPWNPFTLGSVQGIQDGYATRIETWAPRRLRVGRYTATVAVGDRYVKAWGLDPEEAQVDVAVKVVQARRSRPGQLRDWRQQRPSAARTRAAGDVARPSAAEPAPRAAANLPAGTPMPDLRSLPAFSIGLNRKGTLIRFAANVWNAGNSPLVIDGFRTADQDVMAAYQYFFDTDGEQVAYQSVEDSGFYWHAENHNHWHFQDFARYRLLAADRTTVLRDSGKVSFCLANTDAIDYTVDGADWRPENTDLATACGSRGSLSVREVLSAGSGDTYAQYRAGQAFGGIRKLPNGTYYLLVEANPFGALVESDETNNDALRRIRLAGRGGERRVVVPAVGVVDEAAWFGGWRQAAR